MNTAISLSSIYQAIKQRKDLSAFADFLCIDNRTLKQRLTNPEYTDAINAAFVVFCVRRYCTPKPKARPRGAYVANRGRTGEIKRLQGMFASERDFWQGGGNGN